MDSLFSKAQDFLDFSVLGGAELTRTIAENVILVVQLIGNALRYLNFLGMGG